MQYADIAINAKTSKEDLFTYKIPPKHLPYLTKGSLVSVPFSGRKLMGMVFKLKKRKTTPRGKKLKSIEKIIEPSPMLDEKRLKLAEKIKSYYLSPLGKIVFSMIPPPAKRQTSNRVEKIPTKNKKGSPPAFILGEDRFRQEKYIKVINKIKEKNKQVLILSPSINDPLLENIRKKYQETAVYHAQLTKTQRYKTWRKAAKQKLSIVLGTRQALFLPLTNLSAIIIDRSTSDLYKNEQEPFYDIRKIAYDYSKISSTQLFLGGLNPLLSFWHKAQKRNWPVIRKVERPFKATCVNLKKEKSLFSQPLKTETKKALKKKKKVLFYLNRRGKKRLSICLNCQHSQHIKPKQKEIKKCPVCQSKNLKKASMGTRGLADLTKEEFPNADILVLDQESNKKEKKKLKKKNFDILISTSLILQYRPKFSLAALILPEISLSFPSFNVLEKAFYELSETASLADKTIAQTFDPENSLISRAANNNFTDFFKEEIKRRKKENDPPFKSIFKLYIKEKKTKKLKDIRKKLIDFKKDFSSFLEISPIVEPIIFKHPYFLLKTDLHPSYHLKKKLRKFSSLKIDRDPKKLF